VKWDIMDPDLLGYALNSLDSEENKDVEGYLRSHPEAAAILADNVAASGYARETIAVFGMLRDKDIAGVVREVGELVPVVVDGIDARIVGAFELALQLQIVRRIGKDQIDALGRQLCQLGNAVAEYDSMGRSGRETDAGRPIGRPATRHNHDSEL
jgi:hypothetical protein